jgi:hypothetical protein
MKIYLLIVILLIFDCFLSIGQIKKHNLSDFEDNIKSSMGYDSIISRFGYPSTTTGSGLIILVYTLVDSTFVTIGCHNTGTLYAKFQDKDGSLRDLIYIQTIDQPRIKKKEKKPNRKDKN